MSFFSGMLPGIREARGPLAAGFLWLAAAYLWLAGAVGDITKSPAGARIRGLENEFGVVPLVAVLGLAAYLLGSLSIALTDRLSEIGTAQAQRLVDAERTYYVVRNQPRWQAAQRVEPGSVGATRRVLSRILILHVPIRTNGASSVYRRIDEVLGERDAHEIPDIFVSLADHPSAVYDDGPGHDPRSEQQERRALWLFDQAVFGEIFSGDIATRLLTAPDLHPLYQEHDRHRAEAELRFAAAIPGFVLALAIVTTSGLPVISSAVALILAAAFSLMVYLQGVDRRAKAGDVLAIAVGNGLISTPTLELAVRDQIRRRSEPDPP